MAIRLNNGGTTDYVAFDGSASPLRVAGDTAPVTVACWARVRGGAGARRQVFKIGAVSGFGTAFQIRAESSNVYQYVSSSTWDLASATVDSWIYLACAPTGIFGGSSFHGTGSSLTEVTGTISQDAGQGYVMLGAYDQSGSDAAHVEIAYFRCWQAALTEAELEAEMVSTTPVRTANLWLDWPLDGDANDDSGNGRNGTVSGTTFSWVSQPSIAPDVSLMWRTYANKVYPLRLR